MNFPLFLSYQGAIIGNGFVAEISTRGRLLATQEVEGWWLYGVNPGAISADGRNLSEAHAQIRETLRLTFIDFAQESETFAAFKARVEKFFDETDADSVREWQEAVAAIKRSGVDGIDLPRVEATSRMYCVVEERASSQLTPHMNVPAMNLPSARQNEVTPALQLAAAA